MQIKWCALFFLTLKTVGRKRGFSRSKTDGRGKSPPSFGSYNIIVWGKWRSIHAFTQINVYNWPSANTQSSKYISSNQQDIRLASVLSSLIRQIQ